MTIGDGHVCPIPTDQRKRFWTCPECGQLWAKANGSWRLTDRA